MPDPDRLRAVLDALPAPHADDVDGHEVRVRGEQLSIGSASIDLSARFLPELALAPDGRVVLRLRQTVSPREHTEAAIVVREQTPVLDTLAEALPPAAAPGAATPIEGAVFEQLVGRLRFALEPFGRTHWVDPAAWTSRETVASTKLFIVEHSDATTTFSNRYGHEGTERRILGYLAASTVVWICSAAGLAAIGLPAWLFIVIVFPLTIVLLAMVVRGHGTALPKTRVVVGPRTLDVVESNVHVERLSIETRHVGHIFASSAGGEVFAWVRGRDGTLPLVDLGPHGHGARELAEMLRTVLGLAPRSWDPGKAAPPGTPNWLRSAVSPRMLELVDVTVIPDEAVQIERFIVTGPGTAHATAPNGPDEREGLARSALDERVEQERAHTIVSPDGTMRGTARTLRLRRDANPGAQRTPRAVLADSDTADGWTVPARPAMIALAIIDAVLDAHESVSEPPTTATDYDAHQDGWHIRCDGHIFVAKSQIEEDAYPLIVTRRGVLGDIFFPSDGWPSLVGVDDWITCDGKMALDPAGISAGVLVSHYHRAVPVSRPTK